MARATRHATRSKSAQPAQSVHSSQSQSDSEPQNPPPAKAQRAARGKASGSAATGVRRHLRSTTKDGGSPLQALPAVSKKQPKQTRRPKTKIPSRASTQSGDEMQLDAHAQADVHDEAPTQAQAETQFHNEAIELVKEQVAEGGHIQTQVDDASNQLSLYKDSTPEPTSEHDPGSGIFFQKSKADYQPDPKRSAVYTQIRMRRELSFMTGVTPGPDFDRFMDELYAQAAEQYSINEVEPLRARVAALAPLPSRVAELEADNSRLQARVASMEEVQARNDQLERECHRLLNHTLSLTGQVDIDGQLGSQLRPADTIDDDSDDERHIEPTPPPTVALERPAVQPAEILHGSESALALLRKIENNRRPSQPEPREAEASPRSPEAVPEDTATIETPTRRGFFGGISKVLSAISSPWSSRTNPPPSQSKPSRAKQPASGASLIPNVPSSEFALSLTPTPTPVGERTISSRSTQNREHRKAVMKAITNSVRDSTEKEKAKAWAKEAFAKTEGSAGNKRKRIEAGVKVGDLEYISGCKPWNSGGGYGMDDDIFDLSDSDDAPAWAVLQNMVLEQEESANPAKKVKLAHDVDSSDITFFDDASSSELPADVFNSGGKTTSLNDLHPRPSTVPSPMFEVSATPVTSSNQDAPVTHQQNQNVFKELDQHTPEKQSDFEKRAAFERELRRTGHVVGSGSFCVPESSDDEDDDEESNEADSTLWTQQPPPAPTPAHASLPNTAAEASEPAAASEPSAPRDPIDVQRAIATKHTPAKPSRLREMHVPSPGLRTDAGNESMSQRVIASIEASNDHGPEAMNGISAIPDVQSLNIPQELYQDVETFLESKDGQEFLANCNWDDPIAEYNDGDATECNGSFKNN